MKWLVQGFLLFLLLLTIASIGVLSMGDKHLPLTAAGVQDRPSPSDWIQENQIKVYHNKVELEIPHATWASFTNTKSMDPVFDESANALEILPDNPQSIKVGDIISYRSPYGIVIHRVVDRGVDDEGIYYTVKGDNSPLQDPVKVRFSDIKGVVVAIIY